MKQVPVKLGPLALLLTVISICLTMLAVLSFTTARADMRLAEKYEETVTTRFELEAEGQAFIASLRGGIAGGEAEALQDTEEDENGLVRKTFESGGARLRIAVDPADGYRIVTWKHDKEWEENTDIGELWPGFFPQ